MLDEKLVNLLIDLSPFDTHLVLDFVTVLKAAHKEDAYPRE